MTVHVALLVDSPSRRAHGNVASRLALGLVESGRADVDLVCYSDDPAPSWLPPSVAVQRLGVDRIFRAVPPIVRYLRSRQPDVLITRQVHANFVGLAASVLSHTVRTWHGRLVLVQDHPIELSHRSNRRDNKWLARLTYRFADGAICPSPAVRDDTMEWCHLDEGFVGLVPNPIPQQSGGLPPAPHPWFTDGGPPVFVHTSNMTYWKRVDVLVDAFADVLMTQPARLLVVGEGPGRGGVAAHIRSLGLESVAQTVGWVDDPLQFAAHACAFVLASDEEGFAQVLTEAMSVGCPVVTTDALGGGPRFVTQNGTYGLLVPRGSRAALAEAMTQVLNPLAREQYSELGRERVKTFSPLSSAEALLSFLGEGQ